MTIDKKMKNNTKPIVSIVSVVRNAGNLIELTIESVLNQSYQNIELIVVDGESSDGTIDILKKFSGKISWISEPDLGIYDAMNKGIAMCHGELIGVIGAGDHYELDAVKNIVDVYVDTDADVIYGNVALIDDHTNVKRMRKSKLALLSKTMSAISHPSTFTKAYLYRSRPFDLSFKIAADYDLFLYLYESGCHFSYSDNLIVNILSGGVSSSCDTIYEVYIVHKKNYGTFRALKVFMFSFFRYLIFDIRRRVLKLLLSSKYFIIFRSYWLRLNSDSEKKK